MNLSKRIEELAGRFQSKAFETSDRRPEIAAVLITVAEELFTLSTDLEHDENEAADYRERA